MYVETVPNRNSRPAILLREGWREGKKVKKRTLANLTDWPGDKVEALRRLLKGERLVAAQDAFAIERSLPHGHVAALLAMGRRIGLDRLIAAKPCRERDLVLAMILERLIHPASKPVLGRTFGPTRGLATTRLWHTTSLAQEPGVEDADVDELYGAMDWLLERQDRIEQALARRHLGAGAPVFYEPALGPAQPDPGVTSSYYEGRSCPLMRFGHNRDGKKSKTQLVYGVLTGRGGRPVAVEVDPGKDGDPATLPEQLDKLKERFGLARVVLVGDRGLLTRTQIERRREPPGLGWIAALKSAAIRQLVEQKHLQLSLFDQQNLAEITAPAFPGERLIACYNPLLAEARARQRADLLAATEKDLDKIAHQVQRRTKTPLAAAAIGQKVGRVIARYKVAKHFQLDIGDGVFAWHRDQRAIAAEAALDGLEPALGPAQPDPGVLRTSEPAARLSAADTVRTYKGLAQVERLFRTLKGIDVLVRPIRHRSTGRRGVGAPLPNPARGQRRVLGPERGWGPFPQPGPRTAPIFLCLLSAYLAWHLRRAWAPLLFDDDTLEQERRTRDPVAPATPTAHAQRKKTTRRTADGLPLHSFDTLIAELATRCRNTCRLKASPGTPTSIQATEPTATQRRAQQLIDTFPVDHLR